MSLAVLAIAIIVFLLVLLIWITNACYIISQFYFSGSRRNEKWEIRSYLRKTTMSYFICYTIAYCCVSILAFLALNDVKYFWSPNPGFQILIVIISMAASIGFMSFYLFVTSRLYYSFKPTMHPIGKRIIYMYIILSVTVAILLNVYAATYFLLQPVLPNSFLFIALPFAISAVIINLYVAISLIYHFTNRLTKFASMRHETRKISVIQPSNNVLSQRQSSYVGIASRHCILSCISMAMFNVCIPLTISTYVWLLPHNINTYLCTACLCFIWHTIEMICVVLGFSFNKKYYFKCCTFCDNKCNKWLTNVAATTITKMRVGSQSKGHTIDDDADTVTRGVTNDTATSDPVSVQLHSFTGS